MLHLLRGATLGTLVALAVSLWFLLAAFGRRLPPAQKSAWLLVACVYSAIAANFLLVELVDWMRDGPWAGWFTRAHWVRFYNAAFVINAIVDAALPAGLLALLLGTAHGRRVSLLAILGMCIVGGAGFSNGALQDWDTLLTTTQVISFLGIGGYLVFCAFVVLGRLPGASRHLAGVVVVGAIFNIVLPIQEVIFQSVGRDAAGEIWHLNQFLQLARMIAQLAIVLAFLKALSRRERPASRVPVAG